MMGFTPTCWHTCGHTFQLKKGAAGNPHARSKLVHWLPAKRARIATKMTLTESGIGIVPTPPTPGPGPGPRGPPGPQRVFHAEFWHGIFPPHAEMRIPRPNPRQNLNPTPNSTPTFKSHAESHADFQAPRRFCFGMGFGMGFQIPRQNNNAPRQNPTPKSFWHGKLDSTPNPTPKWQHSA